MNYSKTFFFEALLNEIIKCSDEERKISQMLARLKEHADASEKTIMSQKATSTTWKATLSEKDYFEKLKTLIQIMESQRSSDIGRKLIDLKNRIHNGRPSLKAVFLTQEFCLWPSFQSVWEAFEADKLLENDLVYIPFNHTASDDEYRAFNYNCYRESGYNAIICDDYDISDQSPDIVFYMKPYNDGHAKFQIDEIKKHVNHTTFISYCLDIQGGREIELLLFGLPFFYHVWRIISYSDFYRDMMAKHGFRDAENVKTIGHPKFDHVHSILKASAFINRDWERKISGRPVIMWNSHFGVGPGVGVGTYFQWKDVILDYFRKNKDIVLLWRPHPLFWGSVLKEPGIEKESFNRMVEELAAQDNIIVDKTGDYRYAFCAANALVSDAATFLVEFNATGRPVMYTPKKGGQGVCDDRYTEYLYIGNTKEDIIRYFDMVRRGEDIMKEKRIAAFIEEFGHIDGKTGEKIKEYLISEIEKEQSNAAKEFVAEALS